MVFKIDWESLAFFGKYAVYMLVLLLIVFLITLITPKIAKKIDSYRNNPARVKKSAYDLDKGEVRSIYDPQMPDDKNENEISDDGADLNDGK